MRRTFPLFLAFLLAPALHAASRSEPDQVFPLSSGGRFSLENVNGNVAIEGWDRAEVSISAMKKGSSDADLDRMKIAIDAKPDWVQVSTKYETSGWRSSGGSVDYTVKVPRNAVLDEVELVNGSVTLTGVSGRVELSSVNGSVTASDVAADATLETVNGTVDARFTRLGTDQKVSLSSVNGRVKVAIPAGADVDLDVDTVNGDIDNDLGLTVEKGKYVGQSLRQRLGAGGAKLEIETVNGTVSIVKN